MCVRLHSLSPHIGLEDLTPSHHWVLWRRSLSEYQETAQYLSGLDFPEAILNSLLLKAQLPSKTVGVVNCTPYDSWLERACLRCL